MPGLQQIQALLYLARKHAILLAAVMILPLAAGWLYARRQEPVFSAGATIQIKPHPATYLGSGEIWIDADSKLIPDQLYRIRSDRELARRVVERVRGWAARDPLPEFLGPGVDAAAFRTSAGALLPHEVTRLLEVEPVADTSYYLVSIRGKTAPLITALANAYAAEFVAQFQEENSRGMGSQLNDYEKGWQERRDFARERLDSLGQDLARLQQENPGVDFQRRENGAQKELDTLAQNHAEGLERQVVLQDGLQAARTALATAGLALESVAVGEGRAWRLSPALGRDAAADPRLSAFVQVLPVVDADSGVRAARERIAALREADVSLAVGPPALKESAEERISLRQRIARAEGDLARSTEAALAGLALAVDGGAARLARIDERRAVLDGTARLHGAALAKAAALERKIEDQRREIDSFDGRLSEAGRVRKATIEAGAGERNLVRMTQEASVLGVRQVSPDLPRIWLMALIAAFGLAGGVLYLVQALDDTVKSREDYDRLVRGLAFLGVVPAIEEEGEDESWIAAVRGRTGTPVVESIRALRTTLHHAGAAGSEIKTILLTSSGPREGKTTLSVNLAASFAQGGQRTLLVDGDLRRPRVHRMTGADNDRGLSTVLAGAASLEACVQPYGRVPGLDVLASGPLPPNPAELLACPAMKALLVEAAGRYERIVIDSPPIVTVTDPCIIAPLVDAVLLVIAHGVTSSRLVRRAREAMDAVGARVSGAVVNNAAPRRGFYGDPYYGYDYRYGYTPLPEGGKAPREKIRSN